MKQKKIYSYCLRKLSVLTVYLLFLTVQVFFNFDIGRKYFYTDSNVFIVNYMAGHTCASTTKACANAPSKNKLRLNKRFEPPAALCEVAVISPVPVSYTTPVIIGSYISYTYSSVVLTVHPRRGPPCVA